MPSWRDVEAEAPELAAAVRERFDAHKHHVLATLRKDGAPRVSGTEVTFRDGELYIGSMWAARKARDLQRDRRFALHSGSDDPPAWTGDAKVAGRFEEITDPDWVRAVNHATESAAPWPSHLFRADITEVVLTRLGEPADHLIIVSWHAGRGLRRIERR